eukprot:687823-Karenia_brevis.AAC.1
MPVWRSTTILICNMLKHTLATSSPLFPSRGPGTKWPMLSPRRPDFTNSRTSRMTSSSTSLM